MNTGIAKHDDGKSMVFREACAHDIPELISLLMDDELGKLREDGSNDIKQCYQLAFEQIDRDPNNQLIVMQIEKRIAGMLQLTFIPYLTHMGSWRCLIEGVRVHREFRGMGLGTRFIQWAITRAEEKQCAIVQLTSDKRRDKALRFYRDLGFEASHEGFKLRLNQK
jgi:ribosomal protein S18 acetylase RimI-like enzyme